TSFPLRVENRVRTRYGVALWFLSERSSRGLAGGAAFRLVMPSPERYREQPIRFDDPRPKTRRSRLPATHWTATLRGASRSKARGLSAARSMIAARRPAVAARPNAVARD